MLLAVLLPWAACAQTAYTWNGTTGNWTDPALWTPNGVPDILDSVTINAGSVTLLSDITVSSLSLGGGTLTGTGTLTVTNVMNWTDGDLTGGGTLAIPAGGTLNIAGTSDHDLSNRVLNNAGTVQWSGGRIRSGSNAAITNTGRWVVNGGTVLNVDLGGTVNFSNDGTFEVGSGTVTFSMPGSSTGVFTNSGSAVLDFAGNYSFNSGTRFTGTGTNRLSSGTATCSGNLTTENLEFAGATLAGTHTFSGTLTWKSGSWGTAGTTTLAAGSTLSIATAVDHDLPARVLDNQGTVLWTGGRVRGGSSGVVNNSGLWHHQASSALNADHGGTFTFNNSGTFRKSVATGGTTIDNVVFNNTGTVDVQTGTLSLNGGGTSTGAFNAAAGTTLSINDGHTLQGGADFTGAGIHRLVSGSVLMSGTFASQTLELAGATLEGTHTFNGALNWTSGRMDGPGTTIIGPGGQLTISTAADHEFTGRALINDGTVTWTGGRIRNGSGSTITNANRWIVSAGSIFNNDHGGSASFVNQGTFEVTLGTTTMAIPGSSTGVFTNAGNAVLDFVANYSFDSGTSFTGTGTNRLSSGTTTCSGSLTTENLEFAGATLAGTHTFTGSLTWKSGSWGTAGSTTLSSGSTLTITTTADHDLPGRTLNSQGTVLWTGGRVRGGSGSVINNSGLWHDQVGNVINNDYGATSAFNNSGTFRKSVASGSTTITSVVFNNTGTVDVQSGNLNVDGGGTSTGAFLASAGRTVSFNNGHTFRGGLDFTGAGLFRLLTGNMLMDGAFASQTLELAGATLEGTNTFTGMLTWTSGRMDGPGTTTIMFPGQLLVVSANLHDLTGRTLENKGIVTWTGGRIRNGSGSTILNRSNWVAQVTNVLGHDFGGVATFVNLGKVDVQLGKVDCLIPGSGTGGIFNCAAGATFNFPSAFTFDTCSFTGAGTNRLSSDTFVFIGTNTTENLEFASGQIEGTNTFAGTLDWLGGRMDGPGTTTIPAGSVLRIRTGAVHDLTGRTLMNSGTVNWTGGRIRNGSGSVIQNLGLWTAVVTDVFGLDYGGSAAFNNLGTLDVQGGTVTFSIGGTNTGTVNAAAGAACVFSAGFSFNDGCVLSGMGVNRLANGAFSLSGTVHCQNVEFTGDTITGTHTITGNGGFTGGFNWISGSLAAPATMSIAGDTTLTVSSAAVHDLNQCTLNNGGTVLHTGGQLRSGNGTRINNSGLWREEAAGGSFTHVFGGATAAFVNTGTFRKLAGTGITTFGSNHRLDNTGVAELWGGVLSVADNFTNSPGATLQVAIGGSTPGTQFGQLQVGDTAALGGTLGLVLTNGFSPTNGASFAILTASPRTGTFASVTGRAIGGGLYFSPTYPANGVTLEVSDGTPSFSTTNFAWVNGQFQMRLNGVANEAYRIDASTNLTAWTALLTNVIPGSAFLDLIDASSPSFPRRFYRAVFLP